MATLWENCETFSTYYFSYARGYKAIQRYGNKDPCALKKI